MTGVSECSQQRSNLKDNGYICRRVHKSRKVRVWLKQNINQITYLIVIMY
ncbi:hypothetical protein [Photorhabdus sp. RW14-46]|nr:hypothetical protein [Photorhabdus sp. RW14-46]